MSPKKKVLIFVVSVGLLLLLFAMWYKHEYSMDKAKEFQVNSPEYSRKLVIATQGSEFKNIVTNDLVDHFKEDSIYIKVIDVSSLPEINSEDYNALVLIHTWENWKPPVEIKEFINRTKAEQYKIIVFTTSGKGSYKMEGIDAITGESKLENSVSYTNQIIKRLIPLLKYKTL